MAEKKKGKWAAIETLSYETYKENPDITISSNLAIKEEFVIAYLNDHPEAKKEMAEWAKGIEKEKRKFPTVRTEFCNRYLKENIKKKTAKTKKPTIWDFLEQ